MSNIQQQPHYQHYLIILQGEYVRRQRVNPAYSLRAFARFLGIHPGTLSNIFNQKRPLPLPMAHKIAEKLSLAPREKRTFLNSTVAYKGGLRNLIRMPTDESDYVLLDESYTNIIAQWEHYAILSLMNLKEFIPNIKWIAERLGISETRAEFAVQNLKRCNLIEITPGGEFRRLYKKLNTSMDIINSALAKSHKESLELAIEKLDTVPVLDRGYFSETMAINTGKLEQARQLIREFKKKLSKLLEEGDRDEVYNLCVQLYPLTIKDKNKIPDEDLNPQQVDQP